MQGVHFGDRHPTAPVVSCIAVVVAAVVAAAGQWWVVLVVVTALDDWSCTRVSGRWERAGDRVGRRAI